MFKKSLEHDDDCTIATAELSLLSPPASPSPTRTGSKRRLRFSEKMQVIPTVHINEMSREEISTIWYVDVDYDAMKNKVLSIVKKMQKGSFEESSKETRRGIEKRTRQGSFVRKQNKFLGITSVLDEQTRQEKEGVHEPELIAKLYQHACTAAHDEAYAMGLKDQAAVQWDHEKTRRRMNSLTSKGGKDGTVPTAPIAPSTVLSAVC